MRPVATGWCFVEESAGDFVLASNTSLANAPPGL